MIDIKPQTAVNLALGSLTLYSALNKNPPEWLTLAALLITVTGIAKEVSSVKIMPEQQEQEMAGMGCDDLPCNCRVFHNEF